MIGTLMNWRRSRRVLAWNMWLLRDAHRYDKTTVYLFGTMCVRSATLFDKRQLTPRKFSSYLVSLIWKPRESFKLIVRNWNGSFPANHDAIHCHTIISRGRWIRGFDLTSSIFPPLFAATRSLHWDKIEGRRWGAVLFFRIECYPLLFRPV